VTKNFDIMMDRAEQRALQLTKKHGVFKKGIGAYDHVPRRHIEFLLHEVGHWLTLGEDMKKVPRRLSNLIGRRFEGLSPIVSDELEIDTSMVTYLAGWALDYWTDPGPIVSSCRRNLNGLLSLRREADDAVYKMFESRWAQHRKKYEQMAVSLARWFRPSVKLRPFPESKFP